MALRRIGVPSIVEANVPIRALQRRVDDVALFIARQFLAGNGHPNDDEYLWFTDYSTENLPSTAIRRVIRFQDPAFQKLTKCQHWDPPLT